SSAGAAHRAGRKHRSGSVVRHRAAASGTVAKRVRSLAARRTARVTNTVRSAKMSKALEGVRVLDMTHVQSGPTATQILAFFGADVIKIEKPGEGDPTRGQLRDVPGADSLYFTMLNGNKRSLTLNPKTEAGKRIFTRLIETCDVMVENFGPGAIDRMGFPWKTIQEINPRMIYASVKGFGPGPYADCKVYENVAQCTGGSSSPTPPGRSIPP